jgi:mersacidin/lichenicidin family type 2 lantibiotic
MSNLNIIRAWKDEEYNESLSQEEIAFVSQNPAGLVELSDEELAGTEGQGGCGWTCNWTCAITDFTF